MPSAGMKQRVFLVYIELSTMRIGEAGFKQLANVISFRVTDAVFHRRMYFACRGEMLVKSLLMAKNRDRYALFLPKLSAHTLSYQRLKKHNIVFLPVAIMTCDVCHCSQSQKSGILLHQECRGCYLTYPYPTCGIDKK